MKLLQDSKIAKALKDYEITEETQSENVSFSKDFEEKMDKFILRKKRTGKIILITQRAAVAAIALALAGSWLYLMLLPRYQDEQLIIPLQPTGQLILRNTEPQMGPDSNLREGIIRSDEAIEEAAFYIKFPTALPENTSLNMIEMFQTGEDGSYPCVATLYHKAFGPDLAEPSGAAFLYYFQYYVGQRRDILLATYNEISRPANHDNPNERWKYLMKVLQENPPETITINDTDVIKYSFFHTDVELYVDGVKDAYHYESDSEYLVLHWILNDVLFRIVAPIFEIDHGVDSFTLDELLLMAEDLIRG